MIKRVNEPQGENAAEQGEMRRNNEKKPFGEKLARNFALAGMLLLTITAVHDAKLPTGQTVLTAVQEMLDTNWNDHLGKIDFVSNLFPETVSVFFTQDTDTALIAPCMGKIGHAWTNDEPYLSFSGGGQNVFAAGEGQVMSVAHGFNEEQIIRIRHQDGLESLYYNLGRVNVKEGDRVTKDTCLGATVNNIDPTIEVRRAGIPIDPTGIMHERSEETQ